MGAAPKPYFSWNEPPSERKHAVIDRRLFNKGLAGAAVLSALGSPAVTVTGALAQESRMAQRWTEYRAIVAEAERLGLASPKVGGGLQSLGVERALPAFGDLLENLERSAKTRPVDDKATDALIERAADLLEATLEDEASPSLGRQPPAVRAATITARPRFEDIAEDYVRLFRTAEVRPQWRSSVAWYASRLKDAENQARYLKVAEATCIPWFVIAIIHGLEASFNFRKHLHNGDSLSARTTRYPPNRPDVWDPPNDWESSAIDALKFDKFDNLEDWSLPRTLYRWEAYNGFRSRVLHNINTPYLWSFSNHYTKGKYVADGVWDGSVVSKQCGAAVMLRELVREGIVKVPEV
jgi:lysozyme family protein